jgi:hypothetical protein
MLKLEQVRAEMIERFERIDRRLAQQEQRISRIDQRVSEIADRLETTRLELLGRLEALAPVGRELQLDTFDDSECGTLQWTAADEWSDDR